MLLLTNSWSTSSWMRFCIEEKSSPIISFEFLCTKWDVETIFESFVTQNNNCCNLSVNSIFFHPKPIFDPRFRAQGGSWRKKNVHQSTRTLILCHIWVVERIWSPPTIFIRDQTYKSKRCIYSKILGEIVFGILIQFLIHSESWKEVSNIFLLVTLILETHGVSRTGRRIILVLLETSIHRAHFWCKTCIFSF